MYYYSETVCVKWGKTREDYRVIPVLSSPMSLRTTILDQEGKRLKQNKAKPCGLECKLEISI